LSWTRRGTVVPGPQQSAILAARSAHAAQQQQHQHQQQQQHQQQYQQLAVIPGHSPSPSITSLASVSSTSSGGSKHRRQRSTSANAAVVDPSKASVTAYDGGKTKVMTGGVMLGAVTSGNKKKRTY
jgi:transcription initiation factor TFIID subunit TAF12